MLRIVPINLEFGEARLYFMDDKGIYRVNINYTYDDKGNWEITQESEVERVRAIRF